MKTILFTLVALLQATIALSQAAPQKQWDKRFGGTWNEEARSVIQTAGGNYVVFGQSASPVSGDKSQPSKGGFDFWLVKLNSNGIKLWDKCFGGSDNEIASTVIKQTTDGGFIFGGYSSSGVSGDKTKPSFGDMDFWLVKTDSNGTKQWDASFGTTGVDDLRVIQPTSDGGYLLAGYSYLNAQQDFDTWLIKINSTGVQQWQTRLGDHAADMIYTLEPTNDGGYILGGQRYYGTSMVTDVWLTKINSTGAVQWQSSYGQIGQGNLAGLKTTADGGFVIAYTYMDATTPTQHTNFRVAKLNSTGTQQWQTTVGGTGADQVCWIYLEADESIVAGGFSDSDVAIGKTHPCRGGTDMWVVKLSPTGTLLWDATYGGSAQDEMTYVQRTSDGGLVMVGGSWSGLSGDKTQDNRGGNDFWLVKLSASTTLPTVLSNFSGQVNYRDSRLTWQTASEINTSHFVIERSNDAINFSPVGTVTASGNSNDIRQYNFTDKEAFANAAVWYYRLKMVDKDGTANYSQVIKLQGNAAPFVISLYPNPARDVLHIKGSRLNSVEIVNQSGAVVLRYYRRRAVDVVNDEIIRLNISGLARGYYFIRAIGDDGKVERQGWVKE